MKINFITTNQGKVESLNKKLVGTDIEIELYSHELTEIQANSAEEISREKALSAYKILKKPLLVHDSSFHINALNGFPGVYIKYVNETIKNEGILKLMEGVKNRSCYFQGSLTYILDEDHIFTFTGDKYEGNLSEKSMGIKSEKAWSNLWFIFIDPDTKLTLAEMEDQNVPHIRKNKKSEFTKFVEWIRENGKV